MNLKVAALLVVAVVPIGKDGGQTYKTPDPPHVTKVAEAKQVPDEAYIKPLDNYLAKTPMAGAGRYFWAAEKRYGVRKELLMAIAYAETNYNRNPQRGSAYNAFSICSYDSTNTTCHYNSYEEAIYAAADTLTNPQKPLGRMNYANLGQLSGKHNPRGPYWASSPHNWISNVTSEVSRITGKKVDATWNWRAQ